LSTSKRINGRNREPRGIATHALKVTTVKVKVKVKDGLQGQGQRQVLGSEAVWKFFGWTEEKI